MKTAEFEFESQASRQLGRLARKRGVSKAVILRRALALYDLTYNLTGHGWVDMTVGGKKYHVNIP